MKNKNVQEYKKNEINTAGRLKLVVMMYDGLISQLYECKNKTQQGDVAGRGMSISKAQRILNELQESLNRVEGGEVAKNLENLYKYITATLTRVNIEGDAASSVDHSINILETLRNAWREVIANSPKGNEQDPPSRRLTLEM
ncbi:MAG: hypothetical protein IEMM0002_0411 [bacterium]|nr:MAG: hypothetical protein IEMM0002_0411 [bacterium]